MARPGWVVCVLVLAAVGGGVVVGSATAVTTDTAGTADQIADSNTSVTTYVASQRAFSEIQRVESAEDIQNAAPERSATVSLQTTGIILLRAPGLGTAVADQSGSDTTERLVALLESDRARLTSTQLQSGGVAKTLALTDHRAVTAVRISDDAVGLAVNVSRLSATRDRNGNGLADDDGSVAVSPPERYRLSFAYEGTESTTELTIAAPSATLEPGTDGDLSLFPGANQSVAGTTTLPAGANLTVVLTTDAGFVRQHTVTVRPDSTFSASFDLSSVSGGTAVTVAARRGDRTLGGRTGTVESLRATATVPPRVEPGGIFKVRNVTLSTAGFLVVRADSADGRILAARSLDAGANDGQVVRVDGSADRLVVQAYADIDGNGRLDSDGPDRQFDDAGEPLGVVEVAPPLPATATVTTDPDPDPVTTTDIATPTESVPTTSVETVGEGETVVVTPTSGPGLGLGASLAALAALFAALAVRSR